MSKAKCITKEQARLICEAHDISTLLNDEEERDLLIDNNPEMYEAYCALMDVAGLLEIGREDE